jgi:hypothetical protein
MLPVVTMSRPGSALSARIACPNRSAGSTVVGSHAGSSRVAETTYLATRLR